MDERLFVGAPFLFRKLARALVELCRHLRRLFSGTTHPRQQCGEFGRVHGKQKREWNLRPIRVVQNPAFQLTSQSRLERS